MGSVCCVARRDNQPLATFEDSAAAVIADLHRWKLENQSEPSPEIRVLEEDLEGILQMPTLSRESVGTQCKALDLGSPEVLARQMKVSMEKIFAHGGHTLSDLSASPSLRNSYVAPTSSTPSKRFPHVPGSQLLRQGSDSLLCGRNSPSNNASEGTSSPMFPVSSIESTRCSHGGSHDGSSFQSIPESTSSTHNKTWSFDSNSLGSHRFKLAQPHSSKSDSNSIELKACVLCSMCVNVNVVVAVLVCGHVYHADCLEKLTPETSKYDPTCPVCTFGEKGAMKKMDKLLKRNERSKAKMFEKLLNNRTGTKYKNKKYRNRVISSDEDDVSLAANRYYEPPIPSVRSSLAKPFLKRHFSLNSKASSSSSESHPVRTGSFLWSKSSK